MSLDKAISHGKEYRKQYHGAKYYSMQCRNHGSCARCKLDRLYKFKKCQAQAESKEDEYYRKHS